MAMAMGWENTVYDVVRIDPGGRRGLLSGSVCYLEHLCRPALQQKPLQLRLKRSCLVCHIGVIWDYLPSLGIDVWIWDALGVEMENGGRTEAVGWMFYGVWNGVVG